MGASEAQRRAFADAVSTALEGVDRTSFCKLVAEKSGETFTAQALDHWFKGSDPSREKVFAAEAVLGLPPGSLSRHLGYIPVDASFELTPEDVLARDTSLPKVVRDSLIAGIRVHREAGRRR